MAVPCNLVKDLLGRANESLFSEFSIKKPPAMGGVPEKDLVDQENKPTTAAENNLTCNSEVQTDIHWATKWNKKKKASGLRWTENAFPTALAGVNDTESDNTNDNDDDDQLLPNGLSKFPLKEVKAERSIPAMKVIYDYDSGEETALPATEDEQPSSGAESDAPNPFDEITEKESFDQILVTMKKMGLELDTDDETEAMAIPAVMKVNRSPAKKAPKTAQGKKKTEQQME